LAASANHCSVIDSWPVIAEIERGANELGADLGGSVGERLIATADLLSEVGEAAHKEFFISRFDG
jgi:hypothetical protein